MIDPTAPFDVLVRDSTGAEHLGQVVTSDLALVTADDLRAPAVVALPDGSQVTAIRIVGPERDADGASLWALEFATDTVPAAVLPRGSSRPLWCAIFGSRLASCR